MVLSLLAAGLGIVTVTAAPPPPAAAAPALDCGSVYALRGQSPRDVWSVNTGTGGLTSVGTYDIANATGNLNGLGITDDGSATYGVLPANSGTGRTVYRNLRSTEATTALGAGVASAEVTHGAVNPANNFYYYGGYSNVGSGAATLSVYGFNTATNTSIGLVARGSVPAGGANGDFAFDQLGRLYVTGGAGGTNILTAITESIPTTAQSTPVALTGTRLSTITTPADQAVNGIAFAGSGLLYLASQQQLFEVQPGTGTVLNTRTLSVQGASVDLASCARPSTIVVRKSFPQGRASAGDQATVAVTGSNLGSGNSTGTTQGTETGVQDQSAAEYAGPVFGTSGTVYSISESGNGTREASASQNGYTRAWSCVNVSNNNAVVASGTGTSGQFTMPASGTAGANVVCTFTNAAQVSAISLDKTAGTPSGNTPGSTIRYDFSVTNTGTVPVSAVTVTDPKVGTVTCGTGTLAVGATRACTPVTYTLTQADVNAGRVDNTASASATATGLPNATATDTTSTTISQAPSLSLTKRAGTPSDTNGNGLVDAGDRIAYTFDVRNTGNVQLTGLAISDAKVGATTCDATSLAPNAATTCRTTAAYTITAADVTAGAVDNTATATATTPAGGSVTSNRSTTSTPVTAPNPALTLDKQVGTVTDTNSSGITDAGDTIGYRFVVTNAGNVRVTGLVISDAKVGATTCPVTSLAVGASTTCTTTTPYTVTATDQANGTVANTATASASPAGGGTVTSPSDTTRTPVATPNPRLAIDKRGAAPVDVNASGITDAGDTIRYAFTVSNTGNVPVRSVAVADPLLSRQTPPVTVTCGATTLAPNASTECTTSRAYTVTEDDETAGRVVNTATATGTNPDGGSVQSAADSVTDTVTLPDAELTLDKRLGDVVDVNGSGITDAGDEVDYVFVVRNTGNVPIDDVAVDDDLVDQVTCAATRLAVGAQTTCTTDAPYVVTADDERAGVLTNTATAVGADPDDGAVRSDPDSVNVPTTQQSAVLTLTKRADDPVDVNGSGLTDAGDTVTYRFTVTNDGNVPIDQILISDPRAPPVTCQATRLLPGASTTCVTDRPYVITAADETAGAAVNDATATGQDPDDDPVTSNTATATTAPVVAGAPALSIDKQVADPVDVNGSGLTDAGDTLTFRFVVTNTGNVPLRQVAVDDDRLAAGVTCPSGPLAPGASRTCTAPTYTITEADEAAGTVDNTASATAIDPDGDDVRSATDATSTPVTAPAPELVLDKSAGTPVDVNDSGLVDAGDTIRYSFAVTNEGNVPVTALAISDELLDGASVDVTCPTRTLAPGASATCTADAPYVVTAADERAGAVTNSATATGRDPDGGRVGSAPDDTRTGTTRPAPSLLFTKSAGTPVDVNGNGLVDAGDTIRYSFTVTNDGNVPVASVAVTDDLAGPVTCGRTRLTPGQTTTCEADRAYVVTAADQAAGSVDNEASASGLDPDGRTVPSGTDTTSTPVVAPDPLLTMSKTAGTPRDLNDSGLVDAGDEIDYTFDVANEGNVPLRVLRIDDPTVGSVACDATVLAPGERTECRTITPYVVTADDEDAGAYTNSAVALAEAPGVGTVRSETDSTRTDVVEPDPTLELEKSATVTDVNGSGATDEGDEIAYSFTIRNTGNVPLDDVTVEDPLLEGLTPPIGVTCPAGPLGTTPATDTVTCTADAPYVVTAADEVAGRVDNIADAVATDPDGGAVTSPDDRTSTPTTLGDAELDIEKSAAVTDVDDSGITDAGDTIAYTFVVTNTGNLTITDVAVADPVAGAVTCAVTELAPGQDTTCTADEPYVVDADDEDAQVVENTATATGTAPGVGAGPRADVASDSDTVNVGVTEQANVLTLRKTASEVVDANDSGLPDAGDEITYDFEIRNDGNTTVRDITVVDDLLTDQDPTVAVVCVADVLAPGESTTCSADGPYVVTTADTEAGEVVNTATAEGTGPRGPVVSNEAVATSEPVIPGAPSLSIVKRAGTPVDVNDSGLVDAGDTVAYTFRVTNDGNVPVRGITVTDDLLPGDVTCPQSRLPAGGAMTCTAAPYTVTRADEGTELVNTATVSGTDPDGGDVDGGPSSTTTTVAVPDPELTLDKQAGAPVDVNDSGLVDAGDTIAYRFVVENTGNVPVTVLRVVDPVVGVVACENVTIPVGESFECVPLAPYTVTADNERAGTVENTAFARGEDPDGAVIESERDSTSTGVDLPVTGLTLVKTAGDPVDVNDSGLVDAGDTVAYSFTVVNDSTVPLRGLVVSDPLLGAVTCLATNLAANGGTTTCTADDPYVITDGDEQAGEVVNTATARATDPDGETVADADSATVDVATPDPSLGIDKAAGDPVDVNGSGLVDAGDTIAYTFTVTNTGNVPVSDVVVVDPLLDAAGIGVTCEATSLTVGGPGGTTTCTADASYVITASDQLGGRVVNRATATGLDPDDGDVASAEDTTRTPVATPAPGVEVEKSADVDDANDSGLVDAGDLVTYTFTVTNTGDVPLADVAVTDDLLDAQEPPIAVTCDPTELGTAPGEDTATCTADAPYEVTDADVEAGVLSNTATATATAPGEGAGPRVPVGSDPDTVNLPTTRQAPVLTLDKTVGDPVDVNDSGITDAGDTVTYAFTVTNDGNVPVSALTIDDPVLADADPAVTVTCTPQRLAPGEEAACETDGDYTITAADEAAGRVLNVATARGEDPDGDAVASNEDSTTTPVTRQSTVLEVDKSAGDPVDVNDSGLVDAGDTIAYTFTVRNDGNVPVTGVTVTDPLLDGVVCTPTRLAPGAVASCEAPAPYVVTTEDELAGEVVNTASASATGPDGPDDVVTSPSDSTSTGVDEPARSLEIEKTAGDPVDVDDSGQTDAGDTIDYTFTVTNTGTVPVTDVTVADDVLAGAQPPIAVVCEADELAPGASTDCAAARPYVITAADEADGEVVNTALASASAPGVGEGPVRQVTSPEDSTETPVVEPDPDLVVEKSATVRDVNGSGLVDAGDEIIYGFTVSNDGNVTVRRVAIDDDLLAAQTPAITVTCESTRLVAGDSTTCTADAPYVVTADDEAAGSVDNTASVTAVRGPADTPVASEPDSTSTTVVTPDPELTFTKQAGDPVDVNASGLVDAGDTIAYTFTVTNTGNVPVTDVTVTDDLLAGLEPPVAVTCEDTTLAADGGTTTCVADAAYVITADDEDAGEVVNTASATASDPDGDDVDSPEATTRTLVDDPAPALRIEKSADEVDVNGSGAIDEGDEITYTFAVTNTGDVPLRDVAVDDDLLAGLAPAISVTCVATTLAADGGTTRCTADAPYVVTAADERAGSVDNTATAIAADPDGVRVDSPSDATTTPTQVPDQRLVVDKSLSADGIDDVAGDGIVDAGDTLTFAFTVTNEGNVPVTGLEVVDQLLADADPAITVTCATDTLEPGESTTCEQSAPYVVTTDDEDARVVENSATAEGTAPGVGDGPGVDVASDPDVVRVPVTAVADVLTLAKTAADPVDVNGSGLVDAGDTIAYSFTLTNDGNVALDALEVEDPLLAGQTPPVGVTCEVTSLAPGESTECTADAPYVVTDADERAGEVVNTATARGLTPGDDETTSNEGSTRTAGLVVPDPALRIDKTAGDPVDVNGSGLTDAGDTIAYTFAVTNAGNVPLTEVAVDDDLLSALDPAIGVTCEATELAPGRSTACTADEPYVVTEADEATGSVDNTAAATGTDPDDGGVRSPDDSTSTPVQEPEVGLAIDKRAADPVDVNDSGLTDAGDTIAYTFTVTNTGTVPVADLVVRDPLLDSEEIGVTCDLTTLAPGGTTECAADAPYTVTGVDELLGEVVNVARAAGTDPDDGEVLADPDTTTTPVGLPEPGLTLEKSGEVTDVNDSGLVDAGDEIAYSFEVTNTGNVPVDDVAVDDDLLADLDPAVGVTCEDRRLAVDGSTTCTADAPYVVTADDETAGVVRNTATATGVDPDVEPVRSDPDSVAVPTATGTAVLTLDKVAADPVDVNDSGITDAGDTIDFSFTVTNEGDVPVSGLRIEDPLLTGEGLRVTCEATRLAPGASTTCEAAPYRVTAADEDAGEVLNLAVATGLDPDRDAVESNEDSTRTPVTAPERILGMEKTAADPVDVNDSGLVDAGDTIEYTFAVTNNGNVPVTVLRVDDPLLAAQDPPITVSCAPVRIGPGEVSRCAADAPYVVTDADEEAGEVVNAARATAIDNTGDPVVSGSDETRTEVGTPDPDLALVKTASEPFDANGSGLVDAGDRIRYAFTVTNVGNVPTNAVEIDDPMLAEQDPEIPISCEATRLGVDEATDCTAEGPYVITPVDQRAEMVENTATAVGADPDGDDVVSNEDSTMTEVAVPRPSISLDKRVASVRDLDGDGLTDAGDEIRWRFEVTNTGNVPVGSVEIDDPLLADTTVSCDRVRVLAPGDGVPAAETRTVCLPADPYVITAADEAAGEVVNTATASGIDPDLLPVTSDEASTRTPVDAGDPGLELDKTALPVVDRDGDGVVDEGDAVSFTFRVTNTGDVAVDDLAIDDPLLAAQAPPIGVSCDATELPVGASTTCTADAPYVITADDAAVGEVVNTATATGTDPDGDEVASEVATETVPTGGPTPVVLGLVKSVRSVTDVNDDGLDDVGDEIVYQFTVSNSSPTLSLDDVTVVDDLLDEAGVAITCEATTLPPAAADGTPSSTTCTSAPYTITDQDEAAGEVVNTATATATDPDGAPLTSEEDSTTTPVTVPVASLELEKTGVLSDANGNGRRDAGDTVRFTFLVTNTGNVPLDDLEVTDDMLAGRGIGVTCPETTLAPGEPVTCEADAPYRVTESDETRGEVVNVATASAQGPDGAVTGSGQATEQVVLDGALGPEAELSIDKRYVGLTDVDADGRASAGDTLLYEFDVTNTGRVAVSGIAVVDPLIPDVECPVRTLAAGEGTTCSGTYTLTTGDAERERVRNVARAVGEGPGGETVRSGSDGVVVRLVDAEPLPPGDPGDPVPTDPGDPGGDGLLPDTGGPAAWVALIGLLLLGGGIGALLWSRRRRSPGRTGRHAREKEVRT